jgi:hypothetical protein
MCCECFDDFYMLANSAAYCFDCFEAMIQSEDFQTQTKEFVSQLKQTRPFHKYDEKIGEKWRRNKWNPTPEEYEWGCREAYTFNSVAAYNRHNCTNYDELCKQLDRYDELDRVMYEKLLEQLFELIENGMYETDIDEEQ